MARICGFVMGATVEQLTLLAGAYKPAQGLVRLPTRVPASLCHDLWTKKKLS